MSGVAKKANSYPLPFDGLATQLTIGAIPKAVQDAGTNIKLVLRYFCLGGETNDRWVEKKCHHFILIVLDVAAARRTGGTAEALPPLSCIALQFYCVVPHILSTLLHCALIHCSILGVTELHCKKCRCRALYNIAVQVLLQPKPFLDLSLL